jgi:SAM-dependent methyltransferase
MRNLHRLADEVLRSAALKPGSVLLDVGAGDGLIAFRALRRIGPGGRVIFSDISRPLIEHSQGVARGLEVDGVDFVQCAAEMLAIAGASVDAVTTRSVLIYVGDKAAAFAEFFRVLRPGGRLSVFEPINAYRLDVGPPPWALDPSPPPEMGAIHEKLRAYHERHNPADAPNAMMDFDENDLLRLARAAGFKRAHLDLRVDLRPVAPVTWDRHMDLAPNPNLPSLRRIQEEILTPGEREQYESHYRKRIEKPQDRTWVSAGALLWAERPPGNSA